MDDGRVSYKEAVEAIRRFGNLGTDEVIPCPVRKYDPYAESFVGSWVTIPEIVRLYYRGTLTYSDAQVWCISTGHSLSELDNELKCIRYGTTKPPIAINPVEKKKPWPYRLVAFLNEVIDIILNDILEDIL